MPATTGPMPTNFEIDTAALMPDFMWDEVVSEGPDELLDAVPFSYTDSSKVKIDQYQNPYGLMPLRGIDAAPDLVTLPGLKVYEIDPGFYGLVTQLRESELTFARQPGTVADPLDVADNLGIKMLGCATMTVSRVRKMWADLLSTGTFTNANASGELTHKYAVEDYQTFSPANDGYTGPGWAADPVNADPIGDLIYWQSSKLNKGTSADFGEKSKILVNPETINDFWNCASIRERFRSKFGATYLRGGVPELNGDNSINALMTGMGLPPFVVYKKGYYATLAAALAEDPDGYTYAIGAKTLIWLGVRPKGQVLGAMKLTRHAGISPYGAGAYPSVTVDNEQKVEIAKGIYVNAHWNPRMPHGYDLEMGFNGAPVVYYRRAAAGITYT